MGAIICKNQNKNKNKNKKIEIIPENYEILFLNAIRKMKIDSVQKYYYLLESNNKLNEEILMNGLETSLYRTEREENTGCENALRSMYEKKLEIIEFILNKIDVDNIRKNLISLHDIYETYSYGGYGYDDDHKLYYDIFYLFYECCTGKNLCLKDGINRPNTRCEVIYYLECLQNYEDISDDDTSDDDTSDDDKKSSNDDTSDDDKKSSNDDISDDDKKSSNDDISDEDKK